MAATAVRASVATASRCRLRPVLHRNGLATAAAFRAEATEAVWPAVRLRNSLTRQIESVPGQLGRPLSWSVLRARGQWLQYCR